MFLAKIYRFKLPRAKKNFEIEMRASVGRQIIICLMQDIQVVFLAFEVFDWSISVINNNFVSQNLIYK